MSIDNFATPREGSLNMQKIEDFFVHEFLPSHTKQIKSFKLCITKQEKCTIHYKWMVNIALELNYHNARLQSRFDPYIRPHIVYGLDLEQTPIDFDGQLLQYQRSTVDQGNNLARFFKYLSIKTHYNSQTTECQESINRTLNKYGCKLIIDDEDEGRYMVLKYIEGEEAGDFEQIVKIDCFEQLFTVEKFINQ
ncbi:hypothetical protein FGO68_gene12847 [Halteria grandinella]|uniref:Uncharacterized protein n=1 Tax=Halteria grandinella TaxID=5974 RepID=A0A8J8NRV0_HALGN|nr:hypothetical protein FGO68_gene12847 [Halteria grandinella]